MLQELKSSGGVVYSVQSTLPEAGGQVGEVPVAVSQVWRPGAPRGGGCVGLRSESASALPGLVLGPRGPTACEFMRARWASSLGRMGRSSERPSLRVFAGRKNSSQHADGKHDFIIMSILRYNYIIILSYDIRM